MNIENIISEQLKTDLEFARAGYEIDKHSYGSFDLMISDPQRFIGRDLSNNEILELGKVQDFIKEEDFRGSLYSAFRELILIHTNNKFGIPRLDEFLKFNTEYDYIKYVAENIKFPGLKLEEKAKENIDLIMKKPTNNSFKDSSQREIELSVIDLREYGLNAINVLRKKKNYSSVLKYIQEYNAIRFPSEAELAEVGINNNRKLGSKQREHFEGCMNILQDGFRSGIDNYKYLEDRFNEADTYKKELIKRSTGIKFVDYVGGKIITDKESILKLDKHLRSDLESIMRVMPFRTKDYLTKGIKDQSIVHAFDGNLERVFLEARLQPWSQFVNGELGDKAHPKYKSNTEEKEAKNILRYSEELVPILVNQLIAKKVTPLEVFGAYAKDLPRHELLDANFDYDDRIGLYVNKS